MGFPNKVADSVLVKCQRCCCLCHKFCGTKIELHHIKQVADGGENTEDNCIPLCLECHADVKSYNPKHPKGHQYTEKELKGHRDSWYEKVKSTSPYTENDSLKKLDIELYENIKELFDEKVQYLLSRLNFAGHCFTDEHINPLYEFCDKCNNPEFEFIDADLEILKSSLRNGINDLLHALSINTLKCGMSEFSVPSQWEIDQPEYFDNVVKDLHDKSDYAWNKYCELVKLARRKLTI